MAFSFSKRDHARRQAVRELEAVLFSYLDGREKAYAVHAALGEASALFGAGATLPAGLVVQALGCPPDDESARLQLVTKALDLFGRQLWGAASISDP